MRFILWVGVNALALAAAAALVDGIRVTGATTSDQALTLLGVGLIFGVVNAIVGPVLKLLTLPFIILTLGLLILAINALLLMLTGWISDQFGLDFHVDGFWSAVLGGIVIAIATWALNLVLDRDGR